MPTRIRDEYLPPSAERLAWLTGFDGSAGTAIVLADTAAIFVDGRYTLQVRAQVDADAIHAGAPHRDAAGRHGSRRISRTATGSATTPG